MVSRIGELMDGFDAPWCLCGGWAVDAWLGRQTREHGDVDIAVFEDDQHALFHHLNGWHLIAHDEVEPDAKEPWDGRRLVLPAHIHASLKRQDALAWVTEPGVKAESDAVRLEIVINERSGDDWVLRPEPPRIALPLGAAFETSRWGLPTAIPEVLLFFKATAYFGTEGQWKRPQDELDFEALLPLLRQDQRRWLLSAIEWVIPGHPWSQRLSG